MGYYPGATHGEIFKVYKFAADNDVPIFSHTRGFGMPGIQEAISNATVTGASLHIVHANSLSLSEVEDLYEDEKSETDIYEYSYNELGSLTQA